MGIVFAVLLSLTAAAPAKGKAKAPAAATDPNVRAKQIFGKAQKLYAQGKYADAIALFEETYTLKPHAVIFYNIGKCWEQLGETAKALRAFRDYLRLLPEASDKVIVGDAIANLERRLKEKGVQQLLVFADPATAVIEIDNQTLGNSPSSIELTAGNHTLRVTAEGYETVDRTFVMNITRATEMTIALRPVPKDAPKQEPVAEVTPAPKTEPNANPAAVETAPAPAPVVVVQQQETGRKRIFTWVAAGLGLAAVGGGVTFGLLSKSASDALLREMHTDPEPDNLVSRAQTMALGANIAWGVAGAAAIVAVVLFILEGR